MNDPPEDATLRLDKWLWFARLAKTRSLAAKLCAGGAVAVGAQTALKPHHRVRVGDTVTVPQGRLVRTMRIVALGTRRGPASEARRLYSEKAPPRGVAGNEEWVPLLDAAEEDPESPVLWERAG